MTVLFVFAFMTTFFAVSGVEAQDISSWAKERDLSLKQLMLTFKSLPKEKAEKRLCLPQNKLKTNRNRLKMPLTGPSIRSKKSPRPDIQQGRNRRENSLIIQIRDYIFGSQS